MNAGDNNDTPTLYNVGFLGSGYDIFQGNPHADLYDPGFRSAVVDMTSYDRHHLTPDQRFRVPDGAEVRQEVACSYESDSIAIHGTSSYSPSLALDVSVNLKLWSAAFSSSVDYQHVRQRPQIQQRHLLNLWPDVQHTRHFWKNMTSNCLRTSRRA